MKQDKDWIDVMRSSLREAEPIPPAGGWGRLERELGRTKPQAPAWRTYWPRIAAVAAVVLCVVAGDLVLRGNYGILTNGDVIVPVADGGFFTDGPLRSGGTAPAFASAAKPALEELVSGESVGVARTSTPVPSKPRATRHAPAPTTGPDGPQIYPPEPETSAAASEPSPADRAAHKSVIPLTGMAITENSNAKTPERASETPTTESQTSEIHATENHVSKSAAVADEWSASAATTSSATTFHSRASERRAAPGANLRGAYGDDLFADNSIPPRRKTSLGLFGGGGMIGGTEAAGQTRMFSDAMSSANGGAVIPLKYGYADYSYRHHLPLSFGLAVRKDFRHGLSIESGVNYTLLMSDVRAKFGTKDLTQKLHFIGVPLRVNWRFFEHKDFSLYIGVGGMAEKCVAAKFGERSVIEKKIQWSAAVAAGAQYRLGGLVSLYFEPEASYYFTQTELRTVRTDSPFTFTLRLGVRFTF